eukprot:SAG31_NODE_914_length_11058_cov_13.316270_7_plen_549_part_00
MSQKYKNPLAEALDDDELTSQPATAASKKENTKVKDKQKTAKEKTKTKKKQTKTKEVARAIPDRNDQLSAIRIQANFRGYWGRLQHNYHRNKASVQEHAQADLEWLQRKCREQRTDIDRKRLHYFDYWKKYDGDDELQPVQKLYTIGTPWCMIFKLLPHSETGEHTRLSYECVEICQRCWAADLYLDVCVTSTKREVLVKLGAPYEVLAKEATEMKLLMRLKDTKGAHAFQQEFMTHYTPNRFSDELQEHGYASPFTSGHRQRIILNRLERVAGIDLLDRISMPPKDEALDHVISALSSNKTIRAQEIKTMMSTHGCFRPHVEHVKELGPKIKELAAALVMDKNFIVYPPNKQLNSAQQVVYDTQRMHFEQRGIKTVSYETLHDAVEILEKYSSTPQAQVEVFHGTLSKFFPTHNHVELKLFKERWGKLSLVCTPTVQGKQPESNQTDTYFKESEDRVHMAAFFVPLDGIRDYFGDDIGLYTAWLALYTRLLIYPAVTGLILYLLGSFAFDSIDDNWLSIPYSIYMSLWSVLFLNFWLRRENELKFLW